jgi:carbamoyl-phosphate synthase large subunit
MRDTKNPFHILFTCSGRRVELIQRFRDAMQTLGLQGNIYVCESSKYTASLQVADEYIQSPPVRKVDYIPKLLEIVEQKNISLIVPLTDLDLRSLARHRDRFAALGCEVMIGASQDVDCCRDKLSFHRHLTEHGIPSIGSVDMETFYADPFYPCFVKPLAGSGSIGTRKIFHEQQLSEHRKANTGPMLIQPFVEGQEFTIDVYKSRAGNTSVIVPRIRLQVRSGEVEQGITVNHTELIEQTRRLSDSFDGLWGAFCCQCRITADGEILFFELNPRFGGGVPLSIESGANFPLYLLQDLFDMEITTDGSFQENLMMMRYPSSIFETVDDPTSLPGYALPIIQ